MIDYVDPTEKFAQGLLKAGRPVSTGVGEHLEKLAYARRQKRINAAVQDRLDQNTIDLKIADVEKKRAAYLAPDNRFLWRG